MKTITIILRNQDIRVVKLWRTFTVFGEEFGIHRTPTIEGEDTKLWSATHIQTGRVIVECQKSRNAAELEATRIINLHGREKLLHAVKRG